MNERFSLELPPLAEYIATARIFTSTLARHFRAGDEIVEDLKMAVSEACNEGLRSSADDGLPSPIRIVAVRSSERLSFEISGVGSLPSRAPLSSIDEYTEATFAGMARLDLVRALFGDAEMSTDSRGGAGLLRFSAGLKD